MFGIFKKDPVRKLKQEHSALSTRAFEAQRNGDIRSYSALTAEAEAIKEKIEVLQAQESE